MYGYYIEEMILQRGKHIKKIQHYGIAYFELSSFGHLIICKKENTLTSMVPELSLQLFYNVISIIYIDFSNQLRGAYKHKLT